MVECGDQIPQRVKVIKKVGKKLSITVKVVYNANGSKHCYIDPKEGKTYRDIEEKYRRPKED